VPRQLRLVRAVELVRLVWLVRPFRSFRAVGLGEVSGMATFDGEQLERIAREYEAGDASAELERAELDDSTLAEPMVTTSLRLSKSVMDAVGAAAEVGGIRPTALMRGWVEQQLLDQATSGE
jgi:hypothetical protein